MKVCWSSHLTSTSCKLRERNEPKAGKFSLVHACSRTHAGQLQKLWCRYSLQLPAEFIADPGSKAARTASSVLAQLLGAICFQSRPVREKAALISVLRPALTT